MTSSPWSRRVHRRFDRHAASYETAARLQKRVGGDLADALMPLDPGGRYLEIGCGTGILGVQLRRRGITWDKAVFSDIAPAMVGQARRHRSGRSEEFWAVADAARPCWKPASFDVLAGSMILHWLEDPPSALAELLKSVDRRGLVALAFPIRGSLAEWYDLCRQYGLDSAPVVFPPRRILDRPLADWCPILEDEILYPISYSSEGQFLDELRRSGGATARSGHLPRPDRLRRLLREAPARRGPARLRMTWRIARIIARRR